MCTVIAPELLLRVCTLAIHLTLLGRTTTTTDLACNPHTEGIISDFIVFIWKTK